VFIVGEMCISTDVGVNITFTLCSTFTCMGDQQNIKQDNALYIILYVYYTS